VTLHNPVSVAARAYVDAARRLMGEILPVDRPSEKRSFMSRFFGRKAVA
jgi:septum site-determining protein MinD